MPEASHAVAVDAPERLSEADEVDVTRPEKIAGAWRQGELLNRDAVAAGVETRAEVHDPVAVAGDVERALPPERATRHVDRGQRHFDAGVAHRSDVAELASVSGGGWDRDREQQVGRLRPVGVHGERHAAGEERRIDADVELRLLLPLEVRVRHVARRGERGDLRGPRGIPRDAERRQRLIRADRLIPDLAVAHAQLQVVEERLVLHEAFVRDPPGERAGREQRPLVVRAEHAGAVATRREREQIFVVDVVGRAAQVREDR